MSKKFGIVNEFHTRSKFKKTSIGKKPSKHMMNKHKRRGFKSYRGQGH